jgi:hypothetical protein
VGSDLNVWQMIVGVERDLAVAKAARLGTLGDPARRPWRLPRWVQWAVLVTGRPSPSPRTSVDGAETGPIVAK